jgi:transposase
MESENKRRIPARKYDAGFKAEAVKLAEKLGPAEAAAKLGIPDNTLYGWTRKHKNGELVFPGEAMEPAAANKFADEMARLRAELRESQRQLAEEREIVEILDKAARIVRACPNAVRQ